jgi:hypothetical protein
MPKWIGNRIGVGVTFVGDQNASSAIYNLFDQYYGKRIGGWVNLIWFDSNWWCY